MSKVCENLYLLFILQQEEFWSSCSIPFTQGDLHFIVHRGMQLLVLWCWNCIGASVSQGLQRSFALISLYLLAIYWLGITLRAWFGSLKVSVVVASGLPP